MDANSTPLPCTTCMHCQCMTGSRGSYSECLKHQQQDPRCQWYEPRVESLIKPELVED